MASGNRVITTVATLAAVLSLIVAGIGSGMAWGSGATLDEGRPSNYLVDTFDVSSLPYLKDFIVREKAHANPYTDKFAAHSRVVMADIQGPGVITHLWTPNCFGREVVLRIYWDGEENPSVECPVADFFGSGFGYTDFASVLMGMTSGGLYCNFPMPFAKSARLELCNDSDQDLAAEYYYHVIWKELKKPLEGVGYFHAQWRQEKNVPAGYQKPYTILEANGRGHFLGVSLSVQSKDLTFLEGDDIFLVDGDEGLTVRGTSTEDYFDGGWYFRTGTFVGPYHGVIRKEQGKDEVRVSAYRFHMDYPIPFRKSLVFEIQGACVYPADYSSVAYWYQEEPHAPFPPLPPVAERAPSPFVPASPEKVGG